MADDMATNEYVFDDAEIGVEGGDDYDVESKTHALTQKLAALEQKQELIHENDLVKERVDKLRKTIEELDSEKAELRKKLEKSESENKALGPAATQASELEGEVGRLQHGLTTTTNKLKESNSEALNSKTASDSKEENIVKLKAERNLLISRLENLQSSGVAEMESKEKEIISLKKEVEDLKDALLRKKGTNKEKEELVKENEELEMKTIEMAGRVAELGKEMKQKARKISERVLMEILMGLMGRIVILMLRKGDLLLQDLLQLLLLQDVLCSTCIRSIGKPESLGGFGKVDPGTLVQFPSNSVKAVV